MITIVQQPEAYNLTAMLPDLILETEAEVVIEILIDNEIVLEETYTPDAVGRVYVRELGELLETYLAGSGFESTTPTDIAKEFTLKADGEIIGTYMALHCKAYTHVPATEFFEGSVFLNLLKQKKWITPASVQYATVFLTAENDRRVGVIITTSDFENSPELELISSPVDAIMTIDVSLAAIAAKFPGVNADTIIAYRLQLPKEIAVYMVDRAKYHLPMQLRYVNNFGVPETITTRGMVRRKGVSTYESAKMGNVETKFNVERADLFTINSGKLFGLSDYDRYRELFDSETVEIHHAGEWMSIIVTEENLNQSLRMGNLEEVSFTFRFANAKHNNIITGESFMRWILENGEWTDEYMWLDSGLWNDN